MTDFTLTHFAVYYSTYDDVTAGAGIKMSDTIYTAATRSEDPLLPSSHNNKQPRNEQQHEIHHHHVSHGCTRY